MRGIPATVKTTANTTCLRLSQKDVHRLFNAERCKDILIAQKGVYDKNQRLRGSEMIREPIQKLWQLMVSESTRFSSECPGGRSAVSHWERLRRSTLGGAATREGYASMHLRISKVVCFGFTMEPAVQTASQDWAEDITAYSGDSKVNIWLEAVKTKLREKSKIAVHTMGWKGLFDKYDTDGGGSIDAAVRKNDDFCIKNKELYI